MVDLTEILKVLLALIGTIVTYFVIPWIKAKTSVAQQERIDQIYRIAVLAAEQLYGSGNGKYKLSEARRIIEKYGLTFDEKLLEATVYEQLNSYKLDPIGEDDEYEDNREAD